MGIGKLFKQKGYEKIEYIIRRHWVTFLPVIIFFIILLALPLGLYWLVLNTLSALFQNPIYYTAGVLLAGI